MRKESVVFPLNFLAKFVEFPRPNSKYSPRYSGDCTFQLKVYVLLFGDTSPITDTSAMI